MQFEINKNIFLKGLNKVQSAISQKNTLPILANLLIETEKDNIRITATDLDIGISSQIPIETKEPGAITIPAKKLLDIIKELPEQALSIILKKNNMITINCGKAHFKIIGLPKDEFPQIPECKAKKKIIIPQQTLKEMLVETTFAVSKDETRYVLNGVLCILKDKNLQIVATDGRRMAVSKKEVENEKQLEINIIIPSKTTQELIKMLEEDGDVEIVFSDNQVFFSFGDTKIISRLIEGEFPNYEQVIPKKRKEKIKLDRAGFLSAAKRASIFTNPESLAVKLDISVNKMIISKNAPYIGEVKEEISAEYQGENISIGFNPTYLIDVLKVVKDETIELELEDSEKPGVIRKGNEYIYVVLPMQLI